MKIQETLLNLNVMVLVERLGINDDSNLINW